MVEVTLERRPPRVLAALLLCGALVGCADAAGRADTAGSAATATGSAVAVPDIAGRSAADVSKVMDSIGLVAVLRTDPASGPAGVASSTDPSAGTILPVGSVVIVTVGGPAAGWPPTSAERAGAPNLLGLLVQRRPDAFVGLGFDDQPDPIVVFNPGVDVESWRARLDEAAEGAPYRVRMCPRTGLELAQVKAVVSTWRWEARPADGAFAVVIDPATCSVRVSGDWFTDGDVRRLGERFGEAVSVVDATAGRADG
jgi:hypothetical protein